MPLPDQDDELRSSVFSYLRGLTLSKDVVSQTELMAFEFQGQRLSHRAFDGNVIGIRPDYVIEVRQDILQETDGPTLTYALQGVHQMPLGLPKQRAAHPDIELLEERYERFKRAV